jgi:hypothetical protein
LAGCERSMTHGVTQTFVKFLSPSFVKKWRHQARSD